MGKRNILIIEDTPVQIRVLDQILSGTYDIKAATNGRKGLELAQKHPIDLILLDIVMEDMTGYEVLEELRKSEKTKNIPVIFITAMDSSQDEVRGLTAGAVDYITKPFVDEIVRLRIGLHIKVIEQMQVIESLSLYDSLTGIRNRRSFNMCMQEEWKVATENGQCISMIMLDVDHFKKFNDTYGHLGGDICLKLVSEALRNMNRETDYVFRWGGEEFVILLPKTHVDAAEALAERIREAVSQVPITLEDGAVTNVTISLGVSTIYPQEGDRVEDFCDKIDKALYKAKEKGRNRVEVANWE